MFGRKPPEWGAHIRAITVKQSNVGWVHVDADEFEAIAMGVSNDVIWPDEFVSRNLNRSTAVLQHWEPMR